MTRVVCYHYYLASALLTVGGCCMFDVYFDLRDLIMTERLAWLLAVTLFELSSQLRLKKSLSLANSMLGLPFYTVYETTTRF